ncbi:MAG: DUF3520 domain-containing protein [Planctomycetota bacterium]|nr:MAG: DUF3520 domain-containing protein [Planctomycetota bacterium]
MENQLHDYDENRPRSLDERLTDYLLGELPEAERAELEAALESDAPLRARLDSLSATVGLLRGEAAPAALDLERRGALRSAAAVPSGRIVAFPWRRVTAWTAAAAALLLAVGVAAPYLRNQATADAGEAGYHAESTAPLPASEPRRHVGEEKRALPEEHEGNLLDLGYADDSAARGKLGEVTAREELQQLVNTGVPQDSVLSLRAEAVREPPASERFRVLSESAPHVQLESALGEMGYVAVGDPPAEGLNFATQAEPATPGAAAPSAPAVPGEPGVLGAGAAAGGKAGKEGRVRFAGPGDTVPPVVTGATAPAASPPPAGGEVRVTDPDGFAGGTPESEYALRFNLDPQAQESTRLRAGLVELGYRDGDADEETAYYFGVRLGLLEKGKEDALAGWEVRDGYGRAYRGDHVLQHLRPCREKESPRDMFFRFYGDNPFVNADSDRLSTFAADVDTASYPLVRNYLVNGHIPPKAAIRTEEFVNYFKSELAPPKEGDFAIHLEQAPSIFGGDGKGVALLKVGIKAREVKKEERKPVRLTFVIDSSGSMAEGNRLELVQRTLGLLVEQMRDDDQIGIVTFNSDAREVLAPTAGEERHKIRAALRSLQSGGSTNAAAGLLLGYPMAERQYLEGAVNRVILASDGVANTGQTDQEKILEEVKRRSERSIDLTTVGVGMNNHNDVLLEQLADKGNGSCHYVDDDQEARRVFVDGLVGTLQTVARDVKIQVEFNPAVVKSWRQLGYENRAVADQDFRNDTVDAGEIGAGHEVVALYELEPVLQVWNGPEPVLATVRLRWKPDGGKEFVEIEQALRGVPGTGRFATQAPRLRLSAVAAQYAEVLRRSFWAQGDSYQQLVDASEALARELAGDGAVVELRDMIHKTRALAESWPQPDELALLIEEGRRCRLMEAELVCREPRTREMEELLSQVRRQNDDIERRLAELIRSGR